MKLNKKLFATGIVVTLITISIVSFTKAQESYIEPFFRVNSSSTTPEGVKRADNALIHVLNRSGKDYFVPNKTTAEFNSFRENAPNYVSVSVCGDGVCGDGENELTCSLDCLTPGSEIEYCGNGVCDERWTESITTQTVTVPTKNKICYGLAGWIYKATRDAYFLVTGEMLSNACSATEETIQTTTWTREGSESWETCQDDCVPASSSGCGVCGYNGSGDLCPNFCDGGQMNLVNCERSGPGDVMMVSAYKQIASNNKNIADYFRIASALASIDQDPYNTLDTTVNYRVDLGWKCSSLSGTPCPEGSYCYPNGLTSGTQTTCPAGKFCPTGSYYPRDCPPGTYSTGGAAVCTKCPGGFSSPRSTSIQECYPVFKARDGVCRTDYENPVNSPHDCPDSFSRSTGSPQLAWYGDGRCTGVESAVSGSTYYSPDCFCGNGYCDNNESATSCYQDCYFCGDGICHASESYASCSSDCSCGNGYCDTIKGEFYSPTSEAGSCNTDCRCGNENCDSQAPYNETWQTCLSDCHCGNAVCTPSLGEERSNCSDCACGDGVCDSDEVGKSSGQTYYCLADCHCGNGFCDLDAPYNETATICPGDCGGINIDPTLPQY